MRAKSQIVPKRTAHITLCVLQIQLWVLESLELSLQKVHRNDLNKQRGVGRRYLCTEYFVCVFPTHFFVSGKRLLLLSSLFVTVLDVSLH